MRRSPLIQHRAGCLILPTDSDVLYSLNGLYDAAYDHAPLAVVTFDEGATLDGTALLGDLAVSTTVTSVDRLRTAIRDALIAADSVHGVVHVRVTRDQNVRQIRHRLAGRGDVQVLPEPAAVRQAARVRSRARPKWFMSTVATSRILVLDDDPGPCRRRYCAGL